MKTNDKGILRIDADSSEFPQIIFKPVNSTVWLCVPELCSLFHVDSRTIQLCIDTVCKEKNIDIEKSCKYDLYVRGKHIRYDVREVNLEVIIALSFRINSAPARILREWVIRRCLYPETVILPLSSDLTDFCLN